uniref:Uncharacterized protein n=1 Tax=Medicago truncatula TaxID=3880 RepID=I3ST21_MEDTR|nr:unknown [Medicago truncatula]
MAFIKEPCLMKFNDPICLKETLVRIYSTKKHKNEAMNEMQLLTLTSHATYAMHTFIFKVCCISKPMEYTLLQVYF